jgi:hypothetical protein
MKQIEQATTSTILSYNVTEIKNEKLNGLS